MVFILELHPFLIPLSFSFSYSIIRSHFASSRLTVVSLFKFFPLCTTVEHFVFSLSLSVLLLWIKRENKIVAALVFVVRVWLFSFHALGRRQKDNLYLNSSSCYFFFTIRLHFLLPIRQTVNSRHPPLFPSGRSLHPPTQWIKCASYVYSAVHNFYTTTNLIRNLARLLTRARYYSNILYPRAL